ncbi:MAG: hypothetical protein BWY98_00934 [Tenericutes bacterium ADurb.BinA155]|nr:MAG: hypothetical protein BWY98_00934 [Tenericutes bacterium ADurb.BinA155]
MANRRMISKEVADTSFFTDMPASAQALYFRLVLEADDEGFVASVKTAQFKSNASADDLKILMGKRFILPMKEGVIVIKHWFQENYIAPDHFKRTQWTDLEASLTVKPDGSYTDDPKKGKPLVSLISDTGLNKDYKNPVAIEENVDVNKMSTFCQPKLVEVSISKSSISKASKGEEVLKTTDNEVVISAYAQKAVHEDFFQSEEAFRSIVKPNASKDLLELSFATMQKGDYEANETKLRCFMAKL